MHRLGGYAIKCSVDCTKKKFVVDLRNAGEKKKKKKKTFCSGAPPPRVALKTKFSQKKKYVKND